MEGAFFVLGPGNNVMNVNKRRNVNVRVIDPEGKEMFNEMRVHREKQINLELRGHGEYTLW